MTVGNKEDLISVIVPIYQVEPYFDQCVQSILNQTYQNLEIILVVKDEGDNCLKKSYLYAEKDKRIKVVVQENAGLYAARQIGILAATGLYISFVDSDDWIAPEMYEYLHRLAVDNNVDVVESGVIDAFPTCERKRVIPFSEGCYKGERFDEEIAPYLLGTEEFYQEGITLYIWNKLFKRDAIFKYQVEDIPSQDIIDDIVCTIPCIVESRSLFITHNCYYYYRVRNGSGKREYHDEHRARNYVLNTYLLLSKRINIVYQKERQCSIQKYLLYLLLFRCPFIFDQGQDDCFLTAYGGIRKKDNVILYGAGASGCHMKYYFDSVADSHLVCWVDRNYKDLEAQLNVCSPLNIHQYDYDWIIISILRAKDVQSVKKDLIQLGISEGKIRWILPEYIKDPWQLLKTASWNGKKLLSRDAEGIVYVESSM